MNVFVTGATGFIGSATVAELLRAGHEVTGLARSDESAAKLAQAGAAVQRGSLEDLDGLARAAAAADGVIHHAYIHDFSRVQDNAAVDLRAIQAMGAALEGSDKPLVITSGTALVTGRLATEDDRADPETAVNQRSRSEVETLALAARGVRSAVVRCPPTVHGEGDHGFVPRLIEIAGEKGESAYVGDGANRWAAVHRLDAARLFRLAVEQAPAGSVLHAVGEEGIPTREIAEAIGCGLDLAVASTGDPGHFGWLGAFFALDAPASSAQTRARMGWTPTHPGLREDLGEGHYFGVVGTMRG
jgi:nucleoside-diphosphate-sugar epimerase